MEVNDLKKLENRSQFQWKGLPPSRSYGETGIGLMFFAGGICC